MLSDIIHRYSSHRAACKQWSTALGVVILLAGALGKLNAESLFWAAAPLLLLGLAEAGYAGQERRCAELLKAKKGNEEVGALLPEAASASIVRTAVATLSISIWPFYAALLAIVAAGGGALANKEAAPQMAQAGMVRTAATKTAAIHTTAKHAGCGSGGCGSAAGCGSGSSCGAASGKGCSCGGGAKTALAKKPVQQYLQTTNGPLPLQTAPPRPMPVARPPMNRVMPQNMPPAFQPPAPMTPLGQGPALLQPAAAAPLPPAAPSGAADPGTVNR